MSGKPDSNRRPSPWQGDALPLSYSRNDQRLKYTGFFRLRSIFNVRILQICREFIRDKVKLLA
jgi:hypothetical protein